MWRVQLALSRAFWRERFPPPVMIRVLPDYGRFARHPPGILARGNIGSLLLSFALVGALQPCVMQPCFLSPPVCP